MESQKEDLHNSIIIYRDSIGVLTKEIELK